MGYESFLIQFMNGLASASSLFLVAAGLTWIFGILKILNMAHGHFFMIGVYVAFSIIGRRPDSTATYFLGALAAGGVVGILGYIYALESAPPNPDFIARLATQCDLPGDALRTLREHGASDTSHTDALVSVLTRHGYSGFQEDTIIYSARNALRSVIGMLNSLAALTPTL